jgi:uncharacterized coiled-coil protein SlyX
VSALELLSTTAIIGQKDQKIAELQCKLHEKERTIEDLEKELSTRTAQKNKEIEELKRKLKVKPTFSVNLVQQKESNFKDLFKYYTGIVYVRFCALLAFLGPVEYQSKSKGKDVLSLSHPDGLFLTLCRLRHGFGVKDLAVRFGLTVQSTSVVFQAWLQHMYLKLGQISIWPHRDNIIQTMPGHFKKEFPTTLMILDCTEIKTQKPASQALQSQLYSDYKSSTTLKGLIACDPSGSLLFASELFTGSISDKALTQQCGFYDLLQKLKQYGYIHDGDAAMVDKGFNIHTELQELGLVINIPPFTASAVQMTAAETALTQKIAKHRVHIERLICKVKTYKLLSHRVPTSLFHCVNQIWSVCCYLTLFQDVFVKEKK